jgi:hypothetical protein
MNFLTAGDGPTTEDWASVGIAAGALVIAFGFGISNRRTARRALALSERQEGRRQSRLDLQSINALAWTRDHGRDRILGVDLVVANPTDVGNSIVETELRITYSTNGVLTTVKVPCTPLQRLSPPVPPIETVDLPARLEPHGAAAGWFTFHVPEPLLGGRRIEGYEIVVVDVHGIEATRKLAIFPEVPL